MSRLDLDGFHLGLPVADEVSRQVAELAIREDSVSSWLGTDRATERLIGRQVDDDERLDPGVDPDGDGTVRLRRERAPGVSWGGVR